eukprot:UN09512
MLYLYYKVMFYKVLGYFYHTLRCLGRNISSIWLWFDHPSTCFSWVLVILVKLIFIHVI